MAYLHDYYGSDDEYYYDSDEWRNEDSYLSSEYEPPKHYPLPTMVPVIESHDGVPPSDDTNDGILLISAVMDYGDYRLAMMADLRFTVHRIRMFLDHDIDSFLERDQHKYITEDDVMLHPILITRTTAVGKIWEYRIHRDTYDDVVELRCARYRRLWYYSTPIEHTLLKNLEVMEDLLVHTAAIRSTLEIAPTNFAESGPFRISRNHYPFWRIRQEVKRRRYDEIESRDISVRRRRI